MFPVQVKLYLCTPGRENRGIVPLILNLCTRCVSAVILTPRVEASRHPLNILDCVCLRAGPKAVEGLETSALPGIVSQFVGVRCTKYTILAASDWTSYATLFSASRCNCPACTGMCLKTRTLNKNVFKVPVLRGPLQVHGGRLLPGKNGKTCPYLRTLLFFNCFFSVTL